MRIRSISAPSSGAATRTVIANATSGWHAVVDLQLPVDEGAEHAHRALREVEDARRGVGDDETHREDRVDRADRDADHEREQDRVPRDRPARPRLLDRRSRAGARRPRSRRRSTGARGRRGAAYRTHVAILPENGGGRHALLERRPPRFDLSHYEQVQLDRVEVLRVAVERALLGGEHPHELAALDLQRARSTGSVRAGRRWCRRACRRR